MCRAMQVTVHVKSIAEVDAARAEAEASMQPTDTLEIIVAAPVSTMPAIQPPRQPIGIN